MPRYCLDTSGLSNPLENMPEDIHSTLWARVRKAIEDGVFCWNTEILDELGSLPGTLGECIAAHGKTWCLEVGDDGWPWQAYIDHVKRLQVTYRPFISEYNGNRKGTVGLNDISIIALAMTLKPPSYTIDGGDANPDSVSAGSSSTATVTVNPQPGYVGTIQLSCTISPSITTSGAATAPTCALSPTSVDVVAGETSPPTSTG